MKMRGLFLKIFAILWLAQSFIFIISTAFIVRQRFPSPNTLADALDSNLQHDGELAMRDFDSGGCSAFAVHTRHEPSGAMLLQPNGNVVCRTADSLTLPGLVPKFPNRVEGRQVGAGYVWLVPLRSTSGEPFEYVWFQPPARRIEHHPSLLRYAFPQLPVAIGIGGLTTLILVLLFSQPLVRLRKAARALAQGDLTARVKLPKPKSTRPHSDEFQGLAHDFNHMADRLEVLVGAQRLLLRDVSHELRSPLSRVSVALELAREDATPVLLPHLNRIERETERLNYLIGELLTLSSMATNDRTPAFTEVSLNRLCEELLPDAEYEAQRRPCSVVLKQDSVCMIQGDWQLLHRAVENVVRNAIRFTKPGTEVLLRLCQTDQRAMLEVCDHGPGIAAEEIEKIFRPFYRIDSARSPGTGGFGVGLAIAERAVKLHGGTIQASSLSGGGTCVRLCFPLEEERK